MARVSLHALCVLLVLGADLISAPASGADAPALEGLWRQLLARPTEIPHPPDNRPNACRIALGRALFRDTRLSRDSTRSCASCHRPELAFTDGLARAASSHGGALARNTPSLLDVAWSTALHWDGSVGSLEEQAWRPISHAGEMAGQWPRIEAALEADPILRASFARAFPERPVISADNLAKALAAYQRTIRSPPTRFDAWLEGDDGALDTSERAGLQLFVGKAGCIGCHGGWRLSDGRRHDIGLPAAAPASRTETLAWRTPPLRGVALTGPYMHDGSKASLAEVIEHYAGGFESRPTLSGNMVRGLTLTAREKTQLEAFLHTLSPADPHALSGQAAIPTSLGQDCLSGSTAIR